MEWTEERDLCLCQEILVLEPFKAKKGSIARGQIWGQIAVNLNSLSVPQFRVKQRSVRERYNLLNEKFKAKMKHEEKASGIETDMSEMEKALEEIDEKESAVEDYTLDKKAADTAKAAEMRKRAMEGQKRKSEENEVAKPAKSSRRNGGDTIAYLREKNEMTQKLKAEELSLQKQRLELECKKQNDARKQHEDMMQMLLAMQQ